MVYDLEEGRWGEDGHGAIEALAKVTAQSIIIEAGGIPNDEKRLVV